MCLFYIGGNTQIFKKVAQTYRTSTLEKIQHLPMFEPEKFKSESSLIIMHADDLKLNNKLISDFLCEENNILFCVITNLSRDENISLLLQYPYISNLITEDSSNFEAQINNAIKVYESPPETGRITPDETEQDKSIFTLKNSEERFEVFDKIYAFSSALGCFSDFPNVVQMVSSELLTNAFYNSSRDLKTDQATHPDRSLSLELANDKLVQFSWHLQEKKYLNITITDPFGTLTKARLLQALGRASQTKEAVLDSVGGAGLGLYMLLNASTSIIFFLKRGYFTTVGVQLKLSRRYIEFEREQCSIHIVTL